MITLTEAIENALNEKGIPNPLAMLKSKKDGRVPYKTESSSKDVLDSLDADDLGNIIDSLDEMDEESWNKKNGSSADYAPDLSLEEDEAMVSRFKELVSGEEGSDSEIKKGIAVELEHTDDEAEAREIALDHLSEDSEYYSKLEKAGLDEEDKIYEPTDYPKDKSQKNESKSCGCGGKLNEVEEETLDYSADLYDKKPEEMENEDYYAELYLSLMDLFGGDYEPFIASMDYVAPRPSTFRINLKNGEMFYMTITDRSVIATIEGKKYYLLNVGEEEQASEALSRILSYGKSTLKTKE